MSAATPRGAAALRRKLHGWELLHLRQVVADLHAELEAAQQALAAAENRASWAEDCADRWRDDALSAINESGCTPGLTIDGRVVALPAGALQ